MYRNGRPIDDKFEAVHKLYIRIDGECFQQGEILDAGIRIADQSVNWSKYSLPWDILFGHSDCGVGGFVVRDIPTPVPQDRKDWPRDPKFSPYEYVPKHIPENDNYGHCEIQATRQGVVSKEEKIRADIVKKQFRSKLKRSINILLAPKEAS
jgi:hypothetical protein